MRYRYKLGRMHCLVRGRSVTPRQLGALLGEDAASGQTATLVVANHVSYIDPHVLLHCCLEAGTAMRWMTGIESLERNFGIDAWHLRGCGAFSIDRGVLDKRSMAFAQDALDHGHYPLMIFPEGEASYRTGTVRPFSDGAFRFAVNAHEKNKGRDVRILPLGLRYCFVEPGPIVEKRLKAAMHALVAGLANDATLAMAPLPEDLPPEAMMQQLIRRCGDALHREAFGETPPIAEPTGPILRRVMLRILEALAIEHGVDLPVAGNGCADLYGPEDYSGLTQMKNRLRSLINRKARALPLADIDHLDGVLSGLNPATPASLQGLTWMENVLLGECFPDAQPGKRIANLRGHLAHQRADAARKAEASAETRAHWRRQLADCRRVKLLWLLLDDLARWESSCKPSPEDLDAMLMKLEVMMLNRFRYRGRKDAFLHLGKPVLLSEFAARHPGAARKQLTRLLTEAAHEAIVTLSQPVNKLMLDLE